MVVVSRVHLWRDDARMKQGGNTSSVEYSPAKVKRMQGQQKRQEDRWAARSGPVTVSKIEGGSDAHAGDQEAAAGPAAASEAGAGDSPGPSSPRRH